MNILPPLQTGLSGVSRGLENLREIAADIAHAGTGSPEENLLDSVGLDALPAPLRGLLTGAGALASQMA